LKTTLRIAAAAIALLPAAALAAPVTMSVDWTVSACEAWNREKPLTDELAAEWIKNDKGRGYKTIQMYRTDCGGTYKTELKIQLKDGKATCTYGGAAVSVPDFDVDYLMHATTARWIEMGKGEYGPMRAMMFGRLQFSGPKLEAMGVMGPFESFLLLVGKVPGDNASCPK
jgi:putative sterol carrier protein